MKRTLIARKFITSALLAAGTLTAHNAIAQEVTVKVTNLTNGIYMTPFLVAAHNKSIDLFETGMPASAHLQAMAEGGDISGLVADVANAGADYVANPAAGLLAPGASFSTTLNTTGHHNRILSAVAMLLPTNDGFVGADALKIPKKPGHYTFYLNGYDAGTEANDEIINGGGAPGTAGIPADPGGNSGSGASGAASADSNTTVHIHRGTLGDMDANGGFSDLNSSVHHWLNPVAKLEVSVSGSDEHDD